MIALCRHLLHDGRLCQQASVNGSYFCRHHQNQQTVMAKMKPAPDPYGFHKPLPFVPCDDHATIQLNLFIVVQALNNNRIDVTKANAYNRIFRACQLNLEKLEASRAVHKNTEMTKRVILTPEGDEIAPPPEKLEKDESPIHYKDCPCQSCAERFRGAEPEKHHADCKCGVCAESSDQRSAVSDQESTAVNSGPALRVAPVQAFRSIDALDRIQKVPNYDHYIYGDEIAKHEAQHAARTRAALEAGLEPPEHKPWDISTYEHPSARGYREWREGIDQRRRESIDKWNAEHPDQPKEFKPFLTWGEEQDLKLAEMKRLREQEEARLREASYQSPVAAEGQLAAGS